MPIMLECPLVQSHHNSTANFRVHESVTCLVNGGKRPLLMVYFLKRLETSPFHWRCFCTCTINRLGHAFCRIRDVFTNGALILIYSARSIAETSSASCLSYMRKALPRVNLHYFCLSGMRNAPNNDFGKLWHKHFGYSREKLKTQ